MSQKIIVGPVNRGLKTDLLAFNIDNDSFPFLLNAYQWRGRIKRKRGTSLLNRLKRFFNSTSTSYSSSATITLNGSGVGNILTGFGLQSTGNIVPGSVTITDTISAAVYTDPAMNGNLSPSGTINYSTGVITIAASAGNTVSATFLYYPSIPVMGLRDLLLNSTEFITNLAYDTVYSYNIQTVVPYGIYDVSFYKNPATGTYVGYNQKTNWTPTSWNGKDYQQFWTTNYQGSHWATNGISVPFVSTNVGMQFKAITGVVIDAAGPPALVTLTIVAHGLVRGDFVFINEVVGNTGLNLQTGYVVSADPQAANTVQVELPNATIGGAYSSGGIAQYLTNRSDVTKDCLRWYDGDPTNGSSTAPTFVAGNGWVNFAPPLSNSIYSIGNLPAAIYYLVGARMVVPFKGFLLFIGPVIQTSSAGSQRYLQDTIIWSQRGTPYYTCSFTGSATSADTVFSPVLVPNNQTAIATAFFEDVTGFGGFAEIVNAQPITSVGFNEDVLILGGTNFQKRLIYNGNIITPFDLFTINSELGTGSTFSTITMDRGVLSIGSRGIITTSQISSERIDLDISDQIFEFNLTNNGTERVCSQRDFINEWVYFTYPSNQTTWAFPNQTLQYNYREASWSIFNECYTSYGTFRKATGYTWATIGDIFPTWDQWNEPWDSGASSLLQPKVIAGNQQGFVMIRDEGTGEGKSLSITSFSTNTVTSPNHSLNNGDYIMINGCIGAVGYQVNGRIFSISNTTQNTFDLFPDIVAGAYSGGGTITRMYVPYIQTKQFPASWGYSRKTRLGPQQYLLTKTSNSQITLLIFLSQDDTTQYNLGPIVPYTLNVSNSSLIYETILYTCPESTNLGLTPANVNLNQITALQQEQIWHRVSTSLLGDTIQVGFTISDVQMRALSSTGDTYSITGATQANPCVLTTTGQFTQDSLVYISSVEGMTELNGNIYTVLSSTPTTTTIGVDASAFSAYTSEGSVIQRVALNPFAEVELHGFILEVNPSQLLA